MHGFGKAHEWRTLPEESLQRVEVNKREHIHIHTRVDLLFFHVWMLNQRVCSYTREVDTEREGDMCRTHHGSSMVAYCTVPVGAPSGGLLPYPLGPHHRIDGHRAA